MEGCKVENVHDHIADDGPLITGATVGYNPILSKDKYRLQQFSQTMLHGSVMEFCLTCGERMVG